VSPAFATRATIAMMDGLQVQWLLDRSSVDMPTDLRTFLASLTTVEF
jgi:predicted lipid carrier protein YhbT